MSNFQENNLLNNINKIPVEIQYYIYNTYFSPKVLYSEVTNILNCQLSRNLDRKPLYELFIKHNLIENKYFIDYAIKKDDIFKQLYTEHYINNKNIFVHFNTIESLCLSWLMYLYH